MGRSIQKSKGDSKKDVLDELTDKQELFCQEYCVDRIAGKAAGRAGYSGESAQSLNTEGYRLLKDPRIQKRIYDITKNRLSLIEVNIDFVLNGLKEEALGVGPDTSAKDRIKAHELLGKYLQIFDKKLEDIDDSFEININIIDGKFKPESDPTPD